ncbi:MAG: hypothetical protein ACXWR1_13690 [Bdellovibrionota bacterium]
MFRLLLLALAAHAADTTALYLERQKEIAQIPFFCPIGRAPIETSFDALAVRPSDACRFSGPLDTKRNPLLLEPPFLNPAFSLGALGDLLRSEGILLGADGSFRVGSESLHARVLDATKLKDELFHLRAYPAQWGRSFLSIAADRETGIAAFAALAKPHAGAFWPNPYFSQERSALPRLQGERHHSALTLLSKCRDLGPLPHLLFVGDMHRGEDSAYFRALAEKTDLAFAALEVNRDKQNQLDSFLAAGSPEAEQAALDQLTDRFPKEMIHPFQEIFLTLKAKRVPMILMDYVQEYFNFPYTNTAFHGLPIAMRNQLWTNSLPATWNGTGVVFAGRDHFLDIPSADLQDFAAARFPGVQMAFVNPLEKCE